MVGMTIRHPSGVVFGGLTAELAATSEASVEAIQHRAANRSRPGQARCDRA
jgi:hypothetical protein